MCNKIFNLEKVFLMNSELFDALEKRIERLIAEHATMRREVQRLQEENQRLLDERNGFRARIDAILGRLEGI